MILLVLSAWATPIALDAGAHGALVFEGFDRLAPSGCEAPGCSWAEPPRKFTFGAMPDTLSGDWVHGGTLHLDLPPGEYLGWAMLGAPDAAHFYSPQVPIGGSYGIVVDGEDAFREQVPSGLEYLQSKWRVGDPFPLFGEGLTEWDRQIARTVEWTPFAFTADEDGVDIRVEHIDLQALVVAAESERAEAEVVVEATTLAQRIWYHEYSNQSAASWPIPDVGAGAMTVQFTPWREFPDSDQGVADPALAMEAFRGTRTGRIAWLFGSDDAATFEVSGLEGLEVETGEVHWLDVRGDYELDRLPRPAFVRPSDAELRGEQGATVGLAFTVIVPEDARPRTYEGAITVHRGEESIEIPVTVDVSKLELADHPFPAGYFMDLRPNVSNAYGSRAPEVLEVYKQDVKLMRERGMTAISPRIVANVFPFILDAPDTWDAGLIDDVTRIWREAGGDTVLWLDGFFAMKNSGSYRAPQTIDTEALDMMAEATRRNDISLYTYDEGAGRSTQETRFGNRISDYMRLNHPDVRIVGALEHPRDWAYADRYDIVLHTHRPVPSADRSDAIRAAGAEAWAYNMMPGRLAPNAAWTMRPDGLLTWHWNDNTGSPFSDVDRRVDYERSFLAPDGQTVWPSTLANGFAEGIVDIRVLHTLQLEVEAAEARGRDASRGRAILDNVPRMVDEIHPVGPFDNARVHARSLQWIRDAAAAEALRLQRGRRLRVSEAPAAGEISVERFDWLWRPAHKYSWGPNDDLPYAMGPEITPDGVMAELAWKAAKPGPELRPAASSGQPTTGEMVQLVTDTGLAIALRNLTPLDWGRVMVDGNGTQQQWIEVAIPRRDGPATLTRCSWEGDAGPAPRVASVLSTPCHDTGARVGYRNGDVVELFIPWTVFDHTNANLGLNWWMKDSTDHQSTSIAGGGMVLVPGRSLTNLDTADDRGSIRGHTDMVAGTWDVAATVPAPDTDEEWVWEVWHFGEKVSHGTVSVAAGQTDVMVEVPLHPLRDAFFTMRSPNGGPLHPVAQGVLAKPELSIAPGTPVSGDYQEITTMISNNIADATIETLYEGKVLATTTTTLLAGPRSLRITGATGDAVRVTLPHADAEPKVFTIPFVPLEP